MIKHLSTLVCQQAIVDKQTNSVSYINSFDSITIGGGNLAFPEMLVASLWHKTSDTENPTISLKTEILNPKKSVVKTSIIENIKIETPFHRTHLNINLFEIEEKGEYTIKISIKENDRWKKAIEYPVIIFHNP